MPPLTSQPFCTEWHAFSRLVTASPFLLRATRIVLNTWKSNNPTSTLHTLLLCQHLAFRLARTRMKICNGSDGEESILRRVFLGKNIRNQGAAGRITCEFTMACEPKAHFSSENTGRWTAKRIFLEKIQNLGGVGHITNKFAVTSNARCFLLKKTHGIWKGCWHAFSLKKDTDSGGVGGDVI